MTTLNNTETHDIIEMVYHLYATSDDGPESSLGQEDFLKHAVATAKEFAQNWNDAGLPKERMLESFRNDVIRACILMNMYLHMPFNNQVLDLLDRSERGRQKLSRQRKILKQAEEKFEEYQQQQGKEKQ